MKRMIRTSAAIIRGHETNAGRTSAHAVTKTSTPAVARMDTPLTTPIARSAIAEQTAAAGRTERRLGTARLTVYAVRRAGFWNSG
jgi:hypothetical protein